MRTIEKIVYTAHTHTAGGREGWGKSSDDQLDVKLSPPGSNKPGTNPEQLFGIGYSACFMGAMRRAGTPLGIRVPDDVSIDADVSLGTTADQGFALAVKLTVSLPGLDATQKQQLVDGAHQLCPYSHATRGNIDVRFEIL
ncbi:organic hydroperoxide resistance protein [Roseateles sp. NT4]|uniref:organic hydroperoxide resistance protein n=1 Tax=Roseateles sp. NT4 TaxID=3453715 RepID=UPI003EE9E88B